MADIETITTIEEALQGSYTQKGIAKWWNRKRVLLDGRTPRQALEDGDVSAVLELAQSEKMGS